MRIPREPPRSLASTSLFRWCISCCCLLFLFFEKKNSGAFLFYISYRKCLVSSQLGATGHQGMRVRARDERRNSV